MNTNSIAWKLFSVITYIFFDRKRSLYFSIAFSIGSLLIELFLKVPTFFSCSGAIITISGLFLNIKLSLNFHLGLDKLTLFNRTEGSLTLATAEITEEQEKRVDNIISDEIYGVLFMIFGTLIWAYGGFFVNIINFIFCIN